MKIMLDQGAHMPVRAHKTDAGLDLRTPIVIPKRLELVESFKEKGRGNHGFGSSGR